MSKNVKKPTARIKYYLLVLVVAIAAVSSIVHIVGNSGKAVAATSADANSSTPCVSAPAPAQWKHVIVVMFENKQYSSVIGSTSAPYITNLASKCGTAYSGTSGATPTNNWHDANYKVNGTTDGNYVSKPSYATLTSGISPTAHGLIDDSFSTTTGADNIYNRLQQAGKTAKDYYSGSASSTPCAGSNFSGAYHDAMRYYSNLGGQSTSTTSYCNTHDVPINPNFASDLNNGTLPAFSFVLPTNGENMHDNSVASGDTWAQNFLNPIFDSAQYKSGDTAVFFLWDEDTAIPNVLIAPSIVAGSKVPAPTGNPISHFSALRTWQEMLGITSFLGDTAQAPSLLSYYNGGGTAPPPTVDNAPSVNLTAPANGTTLTSSPTTVSANASDDLGVTKVEFYDGTSLIGTDTSAPYSISWNTSTLTGAHSLTAKAYDTGSHNTTAAAVNVTVSITPTCANNTAGITDKATMVMNVPDGTYSLWTRMMAPDATNNSFYVQIDATCPIMAADATIAANAWTWVDYKDGNSASKITATLAAGNHTITIFKRETGIKIDRVLLLSDTCQPSGVGDNCADTTAPTVALTAPVGGATIAGTTTLSATANDGGGIAKVDFLVNGSIIGTSTASPYQVSWNSTTIADGTYIVQARATDKSGNVTTSANVSINVKNADTTAPSAPTNLSSTKINYNEVDLQWTASTDNIAVTGYRVLRGGTVITTVTGTSYNDTSVAANTSYTYTVVAIDAANNQSTPSNSLNVTTPGAPDTQAPTAPTAVTAIADSATKVTVNWTASTDNTGVTRYDVKRGGVVVGSTTGTSYVDLNVSPAKTYSYIIVASDAAGNVSPDSSPASVTTPAAPDTTAPSTPANLVSSVTTAPQVNLIWTASSDNIAVTGYEVWRNGAKLATTSTADFGDATVVAGQAYTYYVIAYDAAGNKSQQSNQIAVTLPAPPPTATTLTFTPSDDTSIHQKSPNTNYGTATSMSVNNTQKILIKFNVSGVSGRTVKSSKLQLYVTDSSTVGGSVFGFGNNAWSESTIKWNNQPVASTTSLGSLGAVTRGKYVTTEVGNYITGDGTYSIMITSNIKNTAIYATKEATNKPQLIMSVQ